MIITLTIADISNVQAARGLLTAAGYASSARDNLVDVEAPDIETVKTIINQYIPQMTAAQQAAHDRKLNAMSEAALASVFKSLTPAQAETYIQNNVTDLASAKAILKIYARLFIAIRNELWSGLPEA